GRGLDRLIEDIEKLKPPAEEPGNTFGTYVTRPNVSPTTDPNFSLPASSPVASAAPPQSAPGSGYNIVPFITDPDGWPASGQSTSPSRRPSGSMATPQPDARGLSADGIEKAIAQPSPSPQPAADAETGKPASADSDRTPPARPGDAPEAQSAPAGPSPNRPGA